LSADVNVDVVVGVAMAIGLVGTVVPLLPGLPVITVAAFVWVIADGADAGQWIVFGVVAVLAVAGMVIGAALPARGASAAGASKWTLALGAVGAVVGALVIPVVGALIGWPVGVFVGEWLRTRELSSAWGSTWATVLGIVRGTAAQFGAGLAAVSIWAVAAWLW
jgi:uncharacterized protein YqgC (DUF456 family)